MNSDIKNGLSMLLSKNRGLVLGGNDFFYTEHLSRHPFVELLYLYGWHLKSLGVGVLFVENHYIDEPVQTRGFIGQLMYCAFLFDMRVVGIEFKGSMTEYEQYTGKEITAKVTTIAYNEPERLLRLNRVVKDIVEYHTQKKKEKWLVFCGMSHVNDTKWCEGINTLLKAPGVGVQLAAKDFFGKKDFVDVNYRRSTDYLIQLAPPEIYSARLYVDSNVLSVMYSLLYFFSGYRKIKSVNRFGDLFYKEKLTVYPMWYSDLAKWLVTVDPELEVQDLELVASVTFDMTREVCSRETVKNLSTGMSETHMNEIVDMIVLWLEKDLNREDEKSLMRMIFLEKKTLPLGKNSLTQIKNKFHKQLSRHENHLCELFQIMKRLGMSLPNTHILKRIF